VKPVGRAGLFLALALLLVLAPPCVPLEAQTVLIRGDRVMTLGPQGELSPGFVLLRDGRIVSVTGSRPSGVPENALDLRAAVVTPGLLDARSTLGLTGLHPDDDDQDETSGPNQAHIRALDAFDPRDPAVSYALRHGVTTVQAAPGDANSVGGQAGVFKLAGATVEEMVVRSPSALVLSLNETAKLTYGQSRRLPSTRMANVGLIREALLEAQDYRTASEGENPPARDLKKEALGRVLAGEIPALVSAERADELATAIRLAEEFGFVLQIVGGAQAMAVLDRLEEAGVPVLWGPPGDAALTGVPANSSDPGAARGRETARGQDAEATPAALRDRGIPFALVTGDDADAPRTRLLDLAVTAVRGGLTEAEALEAITLSPARILGLDGELGSLEAGKQGDLVLFDGDPLAPGARVTAVLMGGRPVWQRPDRLP